MNGSSLDGFECQTAGFAECLGHWCQIPFPRTNHVTRYVQQGRGTGPYDSGFIRRCRVMHDLEKPQEVMDEDSDVPYERLFIGKTDTQTVLKLHMLPDPLGYFVRFA